MPTLTRPDGEINYLTYGGGYPVLLFAPGGLRSSVGCWAAPADGPPRPWVDWTRLAASGLHRRWRWTNATPGVEDRHPG